MSMFSIIAPVYNVEKYIPAFLNCAFKQTYSDFELILVDDGSPDKSAMLCDDYAARDSRVKVIHKKNGGVSSARNVGLETAIGDWILFFDPDDTFSCNTLQTLVDVISLHPEVEVILFNYTQRWHDGRRKENYHHVPSNEVLNREDISRYLIASIVSSHNVLRAPWTKAYRRSVLLNSGVNFTARTFAEDYQFNLKFFPHLEFAIAIPDCLYDYWIHSGSAISRYHKGILTVWEEDTNVECNFYHKNKTYIEDNVYNAYLQHVFSTYSYALLSVYKNDVRRDELISDSTRTNIVQLITDEINKRKLKVRQSGLLSAILKKDKMGIKRALWLMNIRISIMNILSNIKSQILRCVFFNRTAR